jgi:hypothetical protein
MDPITKANHAKRLLEDDILKEAFAEVEKDIFEEQRKASEAFSQKKSANINQGFYISPKSVGVFSFDAEFEQDYFVPGVRVSSWPNPFFERINVQLDVMQNETYALELTDSRGHKVLPIQKIALLPGLHNIACDAAHLKDGEYILNVSKPDSKSAIKLNLTKRD